MSTHPRDLHCRWCLENIPVVPQATNEIQRTTPEGPFRDCLEAQEAGHSTSGMYLIKPDEAERPVQVWCEQDIDNGGWTVIQSRRDGSVNFFRNWDNYKLNLQALKLSKTATTMVPSWMDGWLAYCTTPYRALSSKLCENKMEYIAAGSLSNPVFHSAGPAASTWSRRAIELLPRLGTYQATPGLPSSHNGDHSGLYHSPIPGQQTEDGRSAAAAVVLLAILEVKALFVAGVKLCCLRLNTKMALARRFLEEVGSTVTRCLLKRHLMFGECP
ncbi:angiopoietin-related protein 1-like protein [Lates japonicus]|uniref:Angiopoietin-related protein 1-like protein n=1 Tax=Lates japonicus TaxID=270547 RepID=A0AAD3R175_LATJO|nr:angiopoietin-related protein 1-like protein [Lates japonicus]